MTIDAYRLAEATAEAAAIVGAVVLPVAWRVLDAQLAGVLIGMTVLLTGGVYALHAVTFDCFRLTSARPERRFSYTQREE